MFPVAAIPPQWVVNRDDRRDLPPEYYRTRWRVVSRNAGEYRLNIVKQMKT